MKRLMTLTMIAGIAATAFAMTSFSKTFDETYNISKSSNLGSNACMVCHVSAKPMKQKGLNKYGEDVKTAMKSLGTKKVTADALHAVEGKHSAGLKQTNLQLIKADKMPGGN